MRLGLGEESAMAKKGRPFVYQSEDEKPVTVSLRLPRDVYDRVARYVKMHPGMTLTEFFLDGARLRLETPADPRDIILSDDNTVIQEVQEMIRAAVQAEIGKLGAFMEQATNALTLTPAPAEPDPALSHDSNTVIQDTSAQPQGRRGGMRQPITDLLREHPEGLSAEEIRVHLKAERPIGDVLQGMRRAGVVRLRGEGSQKRYFIAEQTP